MVIGKGSANPYLHTEQIAAIVAEAVASVPIEGKRILIIIPDGTCAVFSRRCAVPNPIEFRGLVL